MLVGHHPGMPLVFVTRPDRGIFRNNTAILFGRSIVAPFAKLRRLRLTGPALKTEWPKTATNVAIGNDALFLSTTDQCHPGTGARAAMLMKRRGSMFFFSDGMASAMYMDLDVQA